MVGSASSLLSTSSLFTSPSRPAKEYKEGEDKVAAAVASAADDDEEDDDDDDDDDDDEATSTNALKRTVGTGEVVELAAAML